MKFHPFDSRRTFEIVSISDATIFTDAGASWDTARRYRIPRHYLTLVPLNK